MREPETSNFARYQRIARSTTFWTLRLVRSRFVVDDLIKILETRAPNEATARTINPPRAHMRRRASAGSVRTARHAGRRAPRTQNMKAAPMTGTISPTLGLKEIRLPIVGMRGNPNATRTLKSTPTVQPITDRKSVV